LSNTLLLTEVGAEESVPWMKPEDTDIGGFTDQILAGVHRDVTGVAMADAVVIELDKTASPTQIEGIVTRNGGEINELY